MKRFATIMITAAALGTAQVTFAEETLGEQLSRTVQYAELDLSNPKAIEILHRRLARAAEQVCEPLQGRELWRLRERRQCEAAALSQAVAKVDRPLLTRYHQERAGTEVPHVAAR